MSLFERLPCAAMRGGTRVALAVAVVLSLSRCASAGRDDPARGAARQRNAILFVASGLRRGVVDASQAPVLLRLRQQGVDFGNSHALFPTLTMPNAAAISTGHQPGDTGAYGDIAYPGAFGSGNVASLSGDRLAADARPDGARPTALAAASLLALAREQGFFPRKSA